MISRWLWIPLISVWYAGYAYSSVLNHRHGGVWFWICMFAGMCPLWAVVVRHSQAPMLDAVIYDTIIFLAFTVTLALAGFAKGMSVHQYVGLGLVLVGGVMMRIA